MSNQNPTAQRLIRWKVIFACWTLVGFFYAGRNIVSYVGRGVTVQWQVGVLYELIYCYVWALLTPMVFRAARRHRVARGRLLRSLSVHLPAALLVAPVQISAVALIALGIERALRPFQVARLADDFPQWERIIIADSFNGFVIYFVLLGLYYVWERYREREFRAAQLEVRLARAELQNLKSQLHPHFLFNTLHTISVLMMRDVRAANSMLVRLSDLLRLTLDNAGAQVVPLKQELDFLRRYLEIEQTRFHDRLSVRMDVDPAVLDAPVPSLLLQPLVENALHHGIAHRAADGLIEIQAWQENGSVRLQVRDNGPGLPSANGLPEQKGVGLANTRARLAQLYGARHRFELSSAPGGGLLVQVVIPFDSAGVVAKQG